MTSANLDLIGFSVSTFARAWTTAFAHCTSRPTFPRSCRNPRDFQGVAAALVALPLIEVSVELQVDQSVMPLWADGVRQI